MKTAKVNLYSLDELSIHARRRALLDLSDINTDYVWYDFMIDDARRVGVEISEFDIDRGQITGELLQLAEDVAAAIVKEYGGPIQALAANYLGDLEGLRANEANTEEFREEEAAELADEFEKDLLQMYLKDLRDHYRHLISDEAIIDTIEANEYLFFESGKLIPVSMYPPKRRSIGERVRALWTHMRAKFAPVDLVLFAPAAAALVYAFLN